MTKIIVPMMVADGSLGGMFSAERWAYAGEMTLLGMLMVLAVLGLLWIILSAFRYVMSGKDTKVKPEKHTESAPSKGADFPKFEAPAVPASQTADNEALIAAITAAIAAYRTAEGMSEAEAGAFRVVSFRSVRSVGGGRGWNAKH